MVDANRRSLLISMMSLSSASMVFLFCLFALKVVVLQVSSCFAPIHQSFDFCQIFCKRKKEASIPAIYHHISLSFVYLLTVCVHTCAHVHTCAMLYGQMEVNRTASRTGFLLFLWALGTKLQLSGKASASKGQTTTCASQGSHSEHQVGSKRLYLLSNLTTNS